jgi:uncharacterized protein GlcG (DUF336 family)
MANTTFTGPVISDNGFIGPVAVSTATAASTLTVADSGKTIFLNSATEFVTTLPLPASGLRFTFIVKAAPVGTAYTVVTNGGANIIKGQQYNAAGVAGDTGTSDDTITFVASSSVAGDRVELISDGTSWFAYAFCTLAASITFTTAA